MILNFAWIGNSQPLATCGSGADQGLVESGIDGPGEEHAVAAAHDGPAGAVRISSWLQVNDAEIPGTVGPGSLFCIGRVVDNSDGCAADDGVRGIDHGAAHGAIDGRLGAGALGYQQVMDPRRTGIRTGIVASADRIWQSFLTQT